MGGERDPTFVCATENPEGLSAWYGDSKSLKKTGRPSPSSAGRFRFKSSFGNVPLQKGGGENQKNVESVRGRVPRSVGLVLFSGEGGCTNGQVPRGNKGSLS